MIKRRYDIDPLSFKLIKHEFFQYNPEIESNEELNLNYLQEDLLQISNASKKLVIDLGWYGDISSASGSFKILVIKNENWDDPFYQFESRNSDIIYDKLNELIAEYQ
ncbi:hypothetical protein GYB22_05605 [bacterium]|nr:hypothetical protein [bacterium]